MNCDYELEIIMTKIPFLKYSGYVNKGVGFHRKQILKWRGRLLVSALGISNSEREGNGIGQREN